MSQHLLSSGFPNRVEVTIRSCPRVADDLDVVDEVLDVGRGRDAEVELGDVLLGELAGERLVDRLLGEDLTPVISKCTSLVTGGEGYGTI